MAGWVQYDRTGEIVEIKVRDFSGRILDKFVFNGSDSKRFGKVMNILKEAYGFEPKKIKPEIDYGESINQKEVDFSE